MIGFMWGKSLGYTKTHYFAYIIFRGKKYQLLRIKFPANRVVP